jgi:hypothetical protein
MSAYQITIGKTYLLEEGDGWCDGIDDVGSYFSIYMTFVDVSNGTSTIFALRENIREDKLVDLFN